MHNFVQAFIQAEF